MRALQSCPELGCIPGRVLAFQGQGSAVKSSLGGKEETEKN